jgi:hypothetical protein
MRTRNQLGILLLMIAAPVASYAQNQAANPPVPANVPACTQELVEKAEASFRTRMWRSETRFRAERELSAVVRLCAGLEC